MPQERVAFDETSIVRHFGRGKTETVRWDDLESVKIHMTSSGPWDEDVHWVLAGSSSGCLVAGSTDGVGDLLKPLQLLPGFDENVVVEAMGSTSEAMFTCWKAH